MRLVSVGVLLSVMTVSAAAVEFTRGVGVYPGDPKEHFGPTTRIDSSNYRNLALHRPAYHSSAWDYNLTAQLVTDGIKETRMPRWLTVSTSDQGVLKKNEREWILDGNWVSGINIKGKHAWVQIEFGGEGAPSADRIDIDGSIQGRPPDNQNWTATLRGSDDGKEWTTLGSVNAMARPTGEIKASIALKTAARARAYRLEFDTGRPVTWRVGEVTFVLNGQRQWAAGPHHFTSAWKPAGQGEEWVYVDLGAECMFDRVSLNWIRRPAEGAIQVSSDAVNWTSIGSNVDEVKLSEPAHARYVRALATKPATADGYLLTEMEVWGRGGPVVVPAQHPAAKDGRLELAGGEWRLQRESLVKATGASLSKAGFKDDDWVVATVPGTVLASYYNAGAVPDPNYADNQNMISDSFFQADFWYRNEFDAPAAPPAGGRTWLHLDGVNWKAEVYFNGEKLGRIEGAFLRKRFDVTKLLRRGQKNALAVKVEKTATPGSIKEKTFQSPDTNGGVLGADNPTFHASIGWDWIPTIRGRDTGIWNSVWIESTGGVTLENPYVTTKLPLPDTSSADVAVEVTLENHDGREAKGTLRGRFGDVTFETPVTLEGSGKKTVKFDPSTTPALHVTQPKLWWPTGYGDPNLYPVELKFEAGGKITDTKSFMAGIRQFAYSEDGGALRMWINGRRFVPRGGNWGFSESMLRYRAREYDAAVKYHSDMHFNMVRNWVGQIGEDAFYEACDRHGVVVWQDFWLANPWDGPDPDENTMFMENVNDTVLRIRNHASVGLYCGRNEGYPPKPIDDGIRDTLAKLHPGLHYIGSSADDTVSGHGPYQAMPLKSYFTRSFSKFHSEMGMPNIVTMDSLRQMMPEKSMWPQGAMWGLHDFCLTGAQGGKSFIDRIEKSYGGASSIEEWIWLAQFINYEGHRAMFEAQSKDRMGLLMWMSHPTWPSMVWQTYDYYLEPTAGYFGSKKASEPLHIQWNPATDNVEVVNYSAGNQTGLTAQAEILNMDGSVAWTKSVSLDSNEDSTATPIKMEYPQTLSSVHFLRLKLMKGGTGASENLYWRGVEEGNFQALRQLDKVKLEVTTRSEQQGAAWRLVTELQNISRQPAVMVRLKAVRSQSGDRILPAIYSDNYVALMPDERRTIVTELADADTRGEKPGIVVEGFNTGEVVNR